MLTIVLVEQHVMLALEIADTAVALSHGDVALQGDAKAFAADEIPHLLSRQAADRAV